LEAKIKIKTEKKKKIMAKGKKMKRRKNEPASWAACCLSLMNERSYARAPAEKEKIEIGPVLARKQPGRTALLLSFSSHLFCRFFSLLPFTSRARDNYGDRRRHTSSCPLPVRQPTTSGMPAPSLPLLLCKIEDPNP